MSEPINKVLASTSQAFTTAQQKQARDNIGAMAASASSLFYSTSNPSAFISGVSRDSNLSGSGTDLSPLGLNTSITLSNNGESATLAYDQLKLAYSNNDPIISASNGTIFMSGHAGNASSPYTANYDIQGMYIYGTDTYNHITATASVHYSGAEFYQGTDSANIKATGMTLHTNADGDQLVDASSVVRWNSLNPGITEYVDPLGAGTLNSAYSASVVYTGYNWTKRTISASGLPAMDQYGFASVPSNSGTYGVNSSGTFNKITDLYQPCQTSDSNLYAQVVACSEAGRSPVLVGSSGQLLGNLVSAPNATEAVFSRVMPNGGTHQNWHVKSDGTVSSSQVRGFDAMNPYGAIHRTRIGSVFSQNSSNNYVWSIKDYCTGEWEWNDGSYSTYSLRELCTGFGLLDVLHYHWSFWVCHSTEDTVPTSTVAYFEVSPMIELWSTGGAYSTSWAPSNNYTIVPVHGYESSVNQGVTSYKSKWEKLELDYVIPKVTVNNWIDNTAMYSDAIVSPRVKLMGLHTTGDYHYLGIRMGTESVSFLNHL